MRLSQKELRSVIREEAQRLLRERTEGVVEHDERFGQMMKLLAGLMNEYEMDPKAIANLAARRIYERMPKPPWVNDADAHTLKGEEDEKPAGEGEAMSKDASPKASSPKPKAEQERHDDDEMLFDESAPTGWEGTVKAMKKHKEIDNPWALANSMANKGYKSHKR